MTDGPADIPLPPLREDLQILRGGPSYSGAPSWVVLDPVRNRFFSVTYEMFQLLSLWNRTRTVNRLEAALASQYGRQTDSEEIAAVLRMLEVNFFLSQPASGSWRSLHEAANRSHSWFMRLIHNYLFFKVPLVRPDPFIRASWPYVSFLFSRGFLVFSALVGLAGLYMVSRQWDAFVNAFPYVFSLEGAAISVLSVAFIKSLHELGHAYVAHRHGCRIPTMGIAFMVMVPLLYTDVSDAWRLKSRRARLSIDAAGVMTELCVAAFALFAWVFIPDGPLRSAIFVLATAGWILSLFVNVNPFMRFDGYYMLADLLGIDNLQPRAFRHLQWRIRELLFDLGEDPPEPFPPRLDAIVTLYAICTAIYRLLLYLGIALLVYHFTIKLVGIMLFAVEIGFFIIRPVWSEVRQWNGMRSDIVRRPRTYVTLAVAGGAMLLAALPLSTRVSVPALLMPQTFVRLFPGEAGRIETINVSRGQMVKQGDILFVVASPSLDEERRQTETEIALAERRLARIGASAEELSGKGVIESQRNKARQKLQGLDERQARLSITAPFDGRIIDMNEEIAPGQWISRREQLAFLAVEQGIVARGYVAGEDRTRIEPGAEGTFIPDDLSQPRLSAALSAVAVSNAVQLDLPQLASQYGGRIAATAASNGPLVPEAAQYAVTAMIKRDASAPSYTERGVLILHGTPQSFAGRVWRQVQKVLIREAGA